MCRLNERARSRCSSHLRLHDPQSYELLNLASFVRQAVAIEVREARLQVNVRDLHQFSCLFPRFHSKRSYSRTRGPSFRQGFYCSITNLNALSSLKAVKFIPLSLQSYCSSACGFYFLI